MRKKKWIEWAVDLIKTTGKCPGDFPAFGLPTDMLTESEFQQSIKASGVHTYNDCHLVAHVLDVPGVSSGDMKEIDTKDPELTGNLEINMQELAMVKKIAKLKENLHLYVERICLKPNKSLSVPEPLVNIAEYIKKSL